MNAESWSWGPIGVLFMFLCGELRYGRRGWPVELSNGRPGPGDQPGHVDPVRRMPGERGNSVATPAEEFSGAADIAALGVGQPDGQLGQPPPQFPLGRRGRLPPGLEDLVGGERPPLIEQRL